MRYHTVPPVLREMTYYSYSSDDNIIIVLIVIVLLYKYFEFGFDERLQLPIGLQRLKYIVTICEVITTGEDIPAAGRCQLTQ